jgi:hypothetical protein
MSQLDFWPQDVPSRKSQEHWRFRVFPNGFDLFREEGTISVRMSENERNLFLAELEKKWPSN